MGNARGDGQPEPESRQFSPMNDSTDGQRRVPQPAPPPRAPAEPPAERGAVAVIIRAERLLVIRRSLLVRAPGTLCFPGGGIEPGEDESMALVREMQEELGVEVAPKARLWSSITAWGIDLAWWETVLPGEAQLRPNPAEVAEIHWLTPAEMDAHPELLPSNREFLAAWRNGEFALPLESRAP